MTERTRTRPTSPLTVSTGGQTVDVPRQRRLRVTADARPLPARVVQRLGPFPWRPVLVACGSLPFVGAGGYLAGRLGADFIGQVVMAIGAFCVAVLVFSAVSAGHTRHCPGCRWH